jgi:hypothetical protein
MRHSERLISRVLLFGKMKIRAAQIFDVETISKTHFVDVILIIFL